MEEKPFDDWINKKKLLHRRAVTGRALVGYKEGDVFWMSIGVNVGDEQDGKGRLAARPVLVVKGFNRHIFLGIPLTSQSKNGKYYYGFQMKYSDVRSTALLSQVRVLDVARISGSKRIGMINRNTLREIKLSLKRMID